MSYRPEGHKQLKFPNTGIYEKYVDRMNFKG